MTNSFCLIEQLEPAHVCSNIVDKYGVDDLAGCFDLPTQKQRTTAGKNNVSAFQLQLSFPQIAEQIVGKCLCLLQDDLLNSIRLHRRLTQQNSINLRLIQKQVQLGSNFGAYLIVE